MSATTELLEVVHHYNLSACAVCGRWRFPHDCWANAEGQAFCSERCWEEAQVLIPVIAVKPCAGCRTPFAPQVFVAGLPQLCDPCLDRQERARDMFVAPEGG